MLGCRPSRLVASGFARLCLLIGTLACILLLLAPEAPAAHESARQFAVRVQTAELRGKWGDVWQLLHPGQKAFISRALFVRCKSRVQTAPPRTARAVAVSNTLAVIPGVPGPKVRVSTVKVSIGYGSTAPSKLLAVRQTFFGNAWYVIDRASSKRKFIATNFCT